MKLFTNSFTGRERILRDICVLRKVNIEEGLEQKKERRYEKRLRRKELIQDLK